MFKVYAASGVGIGKRAQVTVDVYGLLVPGGDRGAVDRLASWGATQTQLGAKTLAERW